MERKVASRRVETACARYAGDLLCFLHGERHLSSLYSRGKASPTLSVAATTSANIALSRRLGLTGSSGTSARSHFAVVMA